MFKNNSGVIPITDYQELLSPIHRITSTRPFGRLLFSSVD